MKTVSWFSAGVSSAVATKLALNEIDEIIFIHIDDHHPDTLRFVDDCSSWFDREIKRIQSPYKNVNNALLGAGGKGYVNGVAGAPCTRFLKRWVRKEWELEQGELRYAWGMDKSEAHRCDRLRVSMPDQEHLFPLVDQRIDKVEAHRILKASGIKRPAMYDLGYHNNNCIGCVKGGMGYWNKIRVDFPEVFANRAALERKIGGSCISGIFLDELEVGKGRHEDPICDDCGIFCELIAADVAGAVVEGVMR